MSKNFFTRFDTFLLIISLMIISGIGGILWRGDHTFPQVSILQVRNEGKHGISQILLTFNRPMDTKSVEAGFSLTPETSGRFSWAGRKLAYTPDEFWEYGQTYHIRIEDAQDTEGKYLKAPFTHQFHSRDLRIAFLGTQPQNFRQIVLFNISQQFTQILTPADITVRQFWPDPNGNSIYFLGVRETPELLRENPEEVQELFVIDIQTQKITPLSSSPTEQIFSVAPSPRGRFLAAEMRNIQQDNGVRQIWIYEIQKQEWTPFWTEKFGSGQIFWSPNERTLLGIHQELAGFALLPISQRNGEVQYLGNFLRSYGFDPFGKQLIFAASPENDIFSETSHFTLFSQTGQQKNILENWGKVTNPVFSEDGKTLYFLGQPQSGTSEGLKNTFQIWRYSFEDGHTTPLTSEDRLSIEYLSLGPNGKNLLFEQYTAAPQLHFDPDMRAFTDALQNNFSPAEIWTFDLASQEKKSLFLQGRYPQWVP